MFTHVIQSLSILGGRTSDCLALELRIIRANLLTQGLDRTLWNDEVSLVDFRAVGLMLLSCVQSQWRHMCDLLSVIFRPPTQGLEALSPLVYPG